MKFTLRSIGLLEHEAPRRSMEMQFKPMNSDFYSYCLSHGIPTCPTLVPVFYFGINPDGITVGIETHLLTECQFTDGIYQEQPDGIEQVFREYMSEKGFGEDVFNIDSPEKAALFLSNDERLGWLQC